MKAALNEHRVRRSLGGDGRLAYCRTRQRHLVGLGFALDPDSQPGKLVGQAEAGRRLVFNRTITLKDTWAKEAKKGN